MNHQRGMKSLLEICQSSLIKNASSITWLGSIPFKLIEDVLKKVSPKQLAGIEQWNPHLTTETDVLWKNHCINEYSDVKRAFLDGSLTDPDSWRSLYNLKQKEMNEKTMRLSEKLREMKHEQEIKKNSKNAKLLDQNALFKLTKKKDKGNPSVAKRKIGVLFQQTLKEVGRGSLFGASSSKTPPSTKRSEAANLFLGSAKKQKRK